MPFIKKNRHSWDNTLDVNVGYINTTSLGSRKMMIVWTWYPNTAMQLLLNGMLALCSISALKCLRVIHTMMMAQNFQLQFSLTCLCIKPGY